MGPLNARLLPHILSAHQHFLTTCFDCPLSISLNYVVVVSAMTLDQVNFAVVTVISKENKVSYSGLSIAAFVKIRPSATLGTPPVSPLTLVTPIAILFLLKILRVIAC